LLNYNECTGHSAAKAHPKQESEDEDEDEDEKEEFAQAAETLQDSVALRYKVRTKGR